MNLELALKLLSSSKDVIFVRAITCLWPKLKIEPRLWLLFLDALVGSTLGQGGNFMVSFTEQNAELVAHGSRMPFQFPEREAGRRLASVALGLPLQHVRHVPADPTNPSAGLRFGLFGRTLRSAWSPDLEVIRDNLSCVWGPTCAQWGLLLAERSAPRLNSALKRSFACYFSPKTNKVPSGRKEKNSSSI